MPRGKIVRQDDRTSEKATLEAKTKVDEAGLAALTGDGGCFQPGALPSVVAATEAGAQKSFWLPWMMKRKVFQERRGPRLRRTILKT